MGTITQYIQGNQVMLSTGVNLSVCEKTIRAYTEAPISRSTEKLCWGCGSKDHVYAIKNSIICPNKDLAGVKEKTENVRADFNARRKEIRNKKRKADGSGDGKKSDKKFATLGEIKALLAEHSSPPKPSKDAVCLATGINTASMSHEDVLSFKEFMEDHTPIETPEHFSVLTDDSQCLTIAVLATGNPIKPPLPINFDTHLPHLNFSIGKKEDKSFQINIAYDTCAVLNVGYAAYHLAIAKKFPSVVKSLTWAKKEFSPLVLSGIVSEEKSNNPSSKTTTLLPATIEYFTPYVTNDDAPVTLKVALGSNVGVNTIMGLSTIKNAKLGLDLQANVFEAGILKCEPFQVLFKPTSRGIPDLSPFQSNVILNELATIPGTSVTSQDVIECYISEFKADNDDALSKDNVTKSDTKSSY